MGVPAEAFRYPKAWQFPTPSFLIFASIVFLCFSGTTAAPDSAALGSSFTSLDWSKHVIAWMGSYAEDFRTISQDNKKEEAFKARVLSLYPTYNFGNVSLAQCLTSLEAETIKHKDYINDPRTGPRWATLERPLGTVYHAIFSLPKQVLPSSSPSSAGSSVLDEFLYLPSTHNFSVFESARGLHILRHTYHVLDDDLSEKSEEADGVGLHREEESVGFAQMEDFSGVASGEHVGVALSSGQFPAASTAPSSTTPSLQSTSSPLPVKVLSYNIWNLNPPWLDRLDLLKQQLSESGADVIGLQEVRYSFEPAHARDYSTPAILQVEQLGTGLPGYQFVYNPAMTYLSATYDRTIKHSDEGAVSQWMASDLAYISGFQVHSCVWKLAAVGLISFGFRNFSDRVDEHQRGCLYARVSLPTGTALDVFVTHFSLSMSARIRNVVELWEFMQEHATAGVPQILLGDFNDTPDSHIFEFLKGKTTIAGHTPDLTDAWEAVRGTSPEAERDGWTYTTLEEKPKKRIDFILYRENAGSSPTSESSGASSGSDSASVSASNPTSFPSSSPRFSPTRAFVISNAGLRVQPSDHRGLQVHFANG